MEFFAELSCAFLYRDDSRQDFNKWFPHNFEQLSKHDPYTCRVLAFVWGIADYNNDDDRKKDNRGEFNIMNSKIGVESLMKVGGSSISDDGSSSSSTSMSGIMPLVDLIPDIPTHVIHSDNNGDMDTKYVIPTNVLFGSGSG